MQRDQDSLASRLRHWVYLERPPTPEDRNAKGEPIETHVRVAGMWAEVKALTARELLVAAQVQAEVTHTVTIRWRPETRWDNKRITFRSQILNVVDAFDPDGVQRELRITCIEEKR